MSNKLNLTDMEIPDSIVPEGEDAQILVEALLDPSRVDEVAVIIESYGIADIVVDIDADYFVELQENLPDYTLTMGAVL